MADLIDNFIQNSPKITDDILNKRTGYDSELCKLWNIERVNSKYYDAIISGIKVEIKKQKGCQWFNLMRYISNEQIWTIFLFYSKGKVTEYAIVDSLNIKKRLIPDDETNECLKILLNKLPKSQTLISLSKSEIIKLATIHRVDENQNQNK